MSSPSTSNGRPRLLGGNGSFFNASFFNASFRNASFRNASFCHASFRNASFCTLSFCTVSLRAVAEVPKHTGKIILRQVKKFQAFGGDLALFQ
ncbi:MAG: pentapeptide repeat-containing protein [Bryobacteraceae bacterium]